MASIDNWIRDSSSRRWFHNESTPGVVAIRIRQKGTTLCK